MRELRSVRVAAPFQATERQQQLAEAWHDPGCRVVVGSGAVRSGKSQGAVRLLVEAAAYQRSTYLLARQTYREITDSLEPMLLRGDGSLPPLLPPELVAERRASDNSVRLRNGSLLLLRSLDDPSKLLGLTLGGVLLDQFEEVDAGPVGEHLFDTLLGRLNDPAGPRKLIAVLNPGGLTSWQYRRLIQPRTRDRDVRVVHFAMSDNAKHLPADYLAAMLATRQTRPHHYRTYVEGTWGAFEGAAYEELNPRVHVVPPFAVPNSWDRFESMDHGAASPTAWLAWAVDFDGNCIVHDEHYQAGWLVSQHAAEILRRRRDGWSRREAGEPVAHSCWADPTIMARHGLATDWGRPASVYTEYAQHGVRRLRSANNDRAAGYARILELLHPEPERPFPDWHPRHRDRGSPRLFIVSTATNLLEHLRSAPVETDGVQAGKAVASVWESAHGHAHAALRYGAMSRPAPSEPTEPELDDPRATLLRQYKQRLERKRSNLDERRYVDL